MRTFIININNLKGERDMNISGENSGQQNRPGQNNMNNMNGMSQNTGNMNRPVRPGQATGQGPIRPGNGPVRPGQNQGGQGNGQVRPGQGQARPNSNNMGNNMGQQSLNSGINLNKQTNGQTNGQSGAGSVNINKTPANQNMNNMGNMGQNNSQNNMSMGNMNQNMNGMNQNTVNMGQNMNNMNQPLVQPQLRSKISLVGLILSIVGLVCCGLLQIPALICSIIGIKKDKSDKRALAGIIISGIGIVLWILLMINGAATIKSALNKIPSDKVLENELDLRDTYSDENAYTDDRYADTEDAYDKDSLGVVPSTEDSDYDYEDDSKSHSSIYDDEDDMDSNSDTDEVKNYNSSVDPTKIMVIGTDLVFGKDTANDVAERTGLQFTDEDLNSVIEPDDIGYATAYIQNDKKNVAYFYFCNTTDEAKPLSECTLHKIDFVAVKYQDGNSLDQWLDGRIDGGIDPTATLDKVQDILGEPDNTYDDDTGVQTVEYYKQFNQDYKLSFGYYNGKMFEMEVGKY